MNFFKFQAQFSNSNWLLHITTMASKQQKKCKRKLTYPSDDEVSRSFIMRIIILW